MGSDPLSSGINSHMPSGNQALPRPFESTSDQRPSDVAGIRDDNRLPVQSAVRVEQLPQRGILDHEALA